MSKAANILPMSIFLQETDFFKIVCQLGEKVSLTLEQKGSCAYDLCLSLNAPNWTACFLVLFICASGISKPNKRLTTGLL